MDQLLQRMKPTEFSSYEEFIQALLIEGLSNSDMTFDQLNYKLYELNRTILRICHNASLLITESLVQKVCPKGHEHVQAMTSLATCSGKEHSINWNDA